MFLVDMLFSHRQASFNNCLLSLTHTHTHTHTFEQIISTFKMYTQNYAYPHVYGVGLKAPQLTMNIGVENFSSRKCYPKHIPRACNLLFMLSLDMKQLKLPLLPGFTVVPFNKTIKIDSL